MYGAERHFRMNHNFMLEMILGFMKNSTNHDFVSDDNGGIIFFPFSIPIDTCDGLKFVRDGSRWLILLYKAIEEGLVKI